MAPVRTVLLLYSSFVARGGLAIGIEQVVVSYEEWREAAESPAAAAAAALLELEALCHLAPLCT